MLLLRCPYLLFAANYTNPTPPDPDPSLSRNGLRGELDHVVANGAILMRRCGNVGTLGKNKRITQLVNSLTPVNLDQTSVKTKIKYLISKK